MDNARTFEQLTDDDARAEGFATRDELISDSLKYYPRASLSDPLAIINTSTVPGSDGTPFAVALGRA